MSYSFYVPLMEISVNCYRNNLKPINYKHRNVTEDKYSCYQFLTK